MERTTMLPGQRCLGGFLALALAIALVIALPEAGSGQAAAPTRFFRGNSGLVDNFVNQLAEWQGAVAVGTQNGLTLIHPDRMESWKRGENGLPDASVRAVAAAGGRLWAGTHGHGLARLDGGRWQVFTQAGAGLPDDFVNALAPLGNRLFVGTREGLCTFDGLLCETIRLPGAAAGPVTCLAADAATVVAGTPAGAFRVTVDRQVTPVALGLSPEPAVDALALDAGMLFAAGEFGLVGLRPDGSRQAWGRDRFPSTRFAALLPIEAGVLCATARGLVLARSDGGVEQVSLGGDLSSPVAVTGLARTGGPLWVGTAGAGVIRLALPAVGTAAGPAVGALPTPPLTPAGGSPLTDVVVFPPPGMAATPGRTGDPRTGGPSPAPPDRSEKPRPYWTQGRVKPPKPKNVRFFQDILPVMVRECQACHTTGTGKGFPLNDPQMVIGYFKKAGFSRFAIDCEEAGGMFGKVDPKTFQLIQVWVKEGCRE
ncbi:MAG: hypothetical protein GX442_13630 [Candidatus Riflebacteria bacterium]|nr:hypothetical protein [Candidatus Riflebacteria bacterium]